MQTLQNFKEKILLIENAKIFANKWQMTQKH